jgi:hypothetical protein
MINNLYIGIVTQNADYGDSVNKSHVGKVKVLIDGVTTLPNTNLTYQTIGKNVSGNLQGDVISNVDKFEVWAYILSPITGESAIAKYNRTLDVSSITDSNDMSIFGNNSDHGFAPASMFSTKNITDGYSGGPGPLMTSGYNTYGTEYMSENFSNSGKGMFAIPAINSRVLIGFLNGSRAIPIVLGKLNSASEINQIYGSGSSYPDYPGIFENITTK